METDKSICFHNMIRYVENLNDKLFIKIQQQYWNSVTTHLPFEFSRCIFAFYND